MVLLLAALTALPVAAQNADVPPPQRYQFDSNGVDLVSGTFIGSVTDLSIGPVRTGQLSYSHNYGRFSGGADN